MFYSATTSGFYDRTVHGDNIPEDAVEITKEQHASLLDGQALGLVIVADPTGKPVLAPQPEPTDEELAARHRAKRDRLLAESDWVVIKAAELDEPVPGPWSAYRQALRDITEQEDFPQSVTWPEKP
jgi:hypothetical protein